MEKFKKLTPKKVGVGLLMIVVVPLLVFFAGQIMAAMPTKQEQKYTSLTPKYEEFYQKLLVKHQVEKCEAEKAIAKSNWEDSRHGAHVGKDMNVIQFKMQKNCVDAFQPPLQ